MEKADRSISLGPTLRDKELFIKGFGIGRFHPNRLIVTTTSVLLREDDAVENFYDMLSKLFLGLFRIALHIFSLVL